MWIPDHCFFFYLVMTQPGQAAYDTTYMLDCINDETAGATETSRLQHGLYARLY